MSKIVLSSKQLGRNFSKLSLSTLFTLLFVVFCGNLGFAQSTAITGTITDFSGEALIGASVLQKGTTNGVVADLDGKYSIRLIAGGSRVLVFSFIGYEPLEENIGTRSTVNVVMSEDSKNLEEVVVVGYGTTNRRDILGSVTSVKEKEIEQVTPVNAFDAIQGRMSGVQITSNGGPGAGSDIKIRGTSTFSGGTNPLYIVDGQQLEDIDNINPNDIASMEILKDGASAAIYGSKSANGVVIITTKSGKAGELKLNADYIRAYSTISSAIPVANSRQRVFYENARASGNLLSPPRDSLNILFQNSFDLQGLVTRTAVRDQLNVSLSGGGATSKFYWNTGYLSEEGTVLNSSYDRLSTRLKLDADVRTAISAGTTVNLSYEFQKGLNENTVFQQIAERIPYFPIFEPNGDFTPEIAGRQNPVAEATKTRRDDRNFRIQSFNYVQWKITKGLTFKSTLGINFRLQKRNEFDPTIVQTVGRPATGEERYNLSHDIQQENYFTYKKKFGKFHNVSAIAGMQVQRWNEETSRLDAISFLSDNVETFNNVSELNLGNTSTFKFRHSLTALFGDLSYDYKGKYLLKGTVRRDGSSRFGADRRYGYFPSGSIGWRISGEEFMNNSTDKISNLLIRAGFGATGNERIGNYESLLLYRPGFYYNTVNGVAPFQLSNPLLGWESTFSTNLGLDATMLKNRLNISVDLWDKTTNDLLYDVPLPEETGFRSVQQNIGSVQNRGVDISLSGTPLRRGSFEWFSSFNVTFLKNKVLELADEDGFESGSFLIREGESLGNIYGYRNLGIFPYNESNAFSDDGSQLTPVFDDAGKFTSYTLNGSPYSGNVNKIKVGSTTLQGGDIYWEDRNNDFQIDATNDRSIIGNGLAKSFGGFFNEFKYKSLSLSFLIDFNLGNDIFRNYDQARNDLNSANETPAPERIDNAWIKAGDIAEYATLDRARTNNQLGPNSQYISQGDYIRWRNIRFNYAVPVNFYSKVKWISNLSVNVSVNNLMTFTNYTGYNPELGTRGNALQPGVDNLRYPNKRDLIMGLKVQL